MVDGRHARILVCPHCRAALTWKPSRVVCLAGHSFDVSRQGYVNLLPAHLARSRAPGDSRAALRHRARFLSGGYFDRLGDFLLAKCKALLSEHGGGILSLVDAGCGDGYFTRRLAAGLSDEFKLSAVGVDISKWGIELASRRNEEISWIVASNRDLPLARDSVDLLICVFGFPHLECFRRVLAVRGRLVIVEPAPEHLLELRSLIYDDVHTKESEIGHAEGLELIDDDRLSYQTTVRGGHLTDLLAMTPHFYRASESAKAKVERTREVELTVAVRLRAYEPKP